MTSKEWLELWLLYYPKFRWFFLEYGFTKEWYKLAGWAKSACMCDPEQEVVWMKSVMNDVWGKLPDHIFNLRVNPKGWKEFDELIQSDL
jgi:Cu2+-containing amine oxidase